MAVTPATGDPLRLANQGRALTSLVYWDSSGAHTMTPDGQVSTVLDGPLSEVANVSTVGVAFQRPGNDKVIWLQTESSTAELLVASGEQTLRLEGAEFSQQNGPSVFYQRYEPGISEQPSQERTTLRRYHLASATVEELANTGGQQTSTQFSHINHQSAVGLVTAEAFGWTIHLDTTTGAELHSSETAGLGCLGDDANCPIYAQATFHQGLIYALRPIGNIGAQTVDRFGLFSFDPSTGHETPISAHSWDDGLWYGEDLFFVGDLLVLSIKDGDGDPLPALVTNVATGESWTLPEAHFVRPRPEP